MSNIRVNRNVEETVFTSIWGDDKWLLDYSMAGPGERGQKDYLVHTHHPGSVSGRRYEGTSLELIPGVLV